jgi:uncharacterized OsmC-like protein
MKNLIPALALLALFCGCSSINVVPTGKRYPAKAKDCELEVFSQTSPPKKIFTEVCLIDARVTASSFNSSPGNKALDRAKNEACKCGADAIIVDGIGNDGDGVVSTRYGTAVIRAIKF